jgi:AcrR family transcriptional regulator
MPSSRLPAALDARVDGRRNRTQATRHQILTTARSLIIAGQGEPTAKDIAEHVGLTTRTLFRHFPDMGTLLRTVMIDAHTQAQAVMDEPFPSTLSPGQHWRALLDLVIQRRTRTYEFLLPLHISPSIQRHWRARPAANIDKGVLRRRSRLTAILPPMLSSDPLLFEVLDATLSIEFWISLRIDQALPAPKADEVLRYAVNRILPDTL